MALNTQESPLLRALIILGFLYHAPDPPCRAGDPRAQSASPERSTEEILDLVLFKI